MGIFKRSIDYLNIRIKYISDKKEKFYPALCRLLIGLQGCSILFPVPQEAKTRTARESGTS